ncbi:hypothetical protein [Rhizorhabdus sp.]|uniref:hypothetical protein n=1 Tax=Rhizorhabdus sp. TaxID=1968843 RepID=UPI00198539A0|nr:hypothetical protein [Rhizorhabdus sp.]MBD3761923.1 hypothetical protein [Rhizorhabdus sp.]
MSVSEPTMIGVAEATHSKLQRLKEDGHFREMADAYRFGIGLALAQGVTPREISSKTVFSVATIDPQQELRSAIQAVLGDSLDGIPVYKMAERLADWGINELYAMAEIGEIDVVALFNQVQASNSSE